MANQMSRDVYSKNDVTQGMICAIVFIAVCTKL